MAAATENGARYTDYWGRSPVEICDVTVADTNTFDSQFGAVKAAWFEPTTAAAHGLTLSAARVTFATGGALTGKLFVVGDGE